jgi:hypothetical protein
MAMASIANREFTGYTICHRQINELSMAASIAFYMLVGGF